MRLVLDLQGAQSVGSRTRGIGRYSLALAKAILQKRGEHDVFVACSNAVPDIIEALRGELEPLVERGRFVVWDAPRQAAYAQSSTYWAAEAAELIRESFLAGLKPDLIHISSLFEGFDAGTALASVGRLGPGPLTAVTLYDLIPLIFSDAYLSSPSLRKWYHRKLEDLRRADLCLALSESTGKDARERLGLPAERIVTIGGGIDCGFAIRKIGDCRATSLRQRYGLRPDFVMYTSVVGDFRKNARRLLEAFALLPHDVRRKHQLALVCKVDEVHRRATLDTIQACGLSEEEVVLTGYVPDEDLMALYGLCKLFVFPSLYEGFGLPILEAMACGAPVVAGDNSSIREVLDRPEALFDSTDTTAIASKVADVLASPSLRADLSRYGRERAMAFSWAKSATAALESFERLVEEQRSASAGTRVLPPAPCRSSRPRLALVMPSPNGESESAALARALSRCHEVDLIVENEAATKRMAVHPMIPWRNLRGVWRVYDHILYDIAATSRHGFVLKCLRSMVGSSYSELSMSRRWPPLRVRLRGS